MNNKPDGIVLSVIAGAILSLFLPILPAFSWLFFILIVSVFVAIAFRLTWVAFFSAGFVWVLFYANLVTDWQVGDCLKRDCRVKVRVDSLVSPQAPTIFTATLLAVEGQALQTHFLPRVRLVWLAPERGLYKGGEFELIVRLKPSRGLANRYVFNRQTWQLRQGIRANGYIKSLTQDFAQTEDIRQTWRNVILQQLPRDRATATILALTLADRQLLSNDDKQLVVETGTAHLLAISGMHLGLVALMGHVLIRGIVTLLPWPVSQRMQSICQCIFAGGLVMLYAFVADFGVSTLRALTMLILLYAAMLLQRKWSAMRLVLWTVCILIVFEPLITLSPGFWLSLWAVSVVLLYIKFDHDVSQFSLLRLLKIQCFLGLLMWPLSMLLYSGFSLQGVWVNLIAIPLLSFIVLPLCLVFVVAIAVGMQALAQISLEMLHIILTHAWHGLHLLNAPAQGWWSMSLTSISLLLLVTVLAFSLLFPFRLWQRGAIAILILALASINRQPTHWQLTLLDVGQGLALLVRAQNQSVLYDTGEAFSNGGSIAEIIISPYVKHIGAVPDVVIISHGDNDHAGGAMVLLERWAVPALVTNVGRQGLNKAQARLHCVAPFVMQAASLELKVLWPLQVSGQKQGNDDSCVIRISDGRFSLLLTGDISHKVERQLVELYAEELKSDVLLVPHHGSRTSSSFAFLQAVAPELALVSAGFANRFDLPADEIMARYQLLGIPVLNTAEQGEINISVNPKEMAVRTYRRDYQPFWFRNM